jgi:cystathionine beta-lyase
MYGEEWLQEAIDYLEANRDFLADYFRDHFPRIGFHKPEGTYLAWLDCRELALGMDPYEFFLKEAKVALNCGLDFGQEGNGFVRLNFATPRSILHEALERMRAALSK